MLYIAVIVFIKCAITCNLIKLGYININQMVVKLVRAHGGCLGTRS